RPALRGSGHHAQLEYHDRDRQGGGSPRGLIDRMSWKSRTHKTYEARVVDDSLARLASRCDIKSLPFSEDELRTLARRARQFSKAYGSEEKRTRLAKYKTYLCARYGDAPVESVWAALEQINNEIGYEEK